MWLEERDRDNVYLCVRTCDRVCVCVSTLTHNSDSGAVFHLEHTPSHNENTSTVSMYNYTHTRASKRQTFLTLMENFLSQLEQELTSLSLSHFLSLALDCITYTSNTHTHTHTHMFPHPHTHVFPHTHTHVSTHTPTHTHNPYDRHTKFSVYCRNVVLCV